MVIYMDYSLIGKNIKTIRTNQNLTQEQLSEKVGISANFLACIEIGVRKGSFETYINIANSLNVTLDSIVPCAAYSHNENSLKSLLNRCFDKASPSTQELIVKIARDITDYMK